MRMGLDQHLTTMRRSTLCQRHFVLLGPSSSLRTKGFQMDLLNECIAAAHLLCQTKTLPFILTLFTQCCWSLSFSDHHIHNHRDQGPSPLERLQRTERIWKVSSLSRWVSPITNYYCWGCCQRKCQARSGQLTVSRSLVSVRLPDCLIGLAGEHICKTFLWSILSNIL